MKFFLLKWVGRDFVRVWRWNIFLAFSLSIGLTCLLLTINFRTSVEDHLAKNAQSILSADFTIESRRLISKNELEVVEKELGPDFFKMEFYEFFAMLNINEQSRLVLVKVIEDNYPFYGKIINLENNKINPLIFQDKEMFVYSELMAQMNLKVNSIVKLGESQFRIKDFIKLDETQTFRSATLAPKVFIHLKDLKTTNLIQFGSTFSNGFLFKNTKVLSAEESKVLEINKQSILKSLKDPALSIMTAKDASESSGRQLSYLADFMGLAGVIALLITCLGGFFLFRYFYSLKKYQIAIYRSFGLSTQNVFILISLQSLLISILSFIISMAMTFLIIASIRNYIAIQFNFNFEFNLDLKIIAISVFVLLFSGWFIQLPTIFNMTQVKPIELLRNLNSSFKINPWIISVYLIAVTLIFWIFSALVSKSFKNGFYLISLFFILSVFVSGVIYLAHKLVEKIFVNFQWNIKYSMYYLARNKMESFFAILSLTLSFGFLNLVPQLKSSLNDQLELGPANKIPSLFLFDVQKEQWPELQNFLVSLNVKLVKSSPLIRARVLKINEDDYERSNLNPQENFVSREEEQESRFRNRGMNLTYRNTLSDSEKLIEGEKFSADRNEIAQLSIEKRFAERLKIKLNDVLTFDVQGIEIKGVVKNFRSVQWTRFEPNFFIVFQEGYLEEAPQIYLAATERLSNDKKHETQKLISKNYPNISMLDVDRTVENVINLLSQLGIVIQMISLITFFGGFLILFSIIQVQIESRKWEINMLKIFGANSNQLRKYLLIPILLVLIFSAVSGLLMSYLVSGIMGQVLFESWPTFNWQFALVSFVGGFVCTLILSKRMIAALDNKAAISFIK